MLYKIFFFQNYYISKIFISIEIIFLLVI